MRFENPLTVHLIDFGGYVLTFCTVLYSLCFASNNCKLCINVPLDEHFKHSQIHMHNCTCFLCVTWTYILYIQSNMSVIAMGREYWMIYRWYGISRRRMIWLLPPPPPPVSNLPLFLSLPVCRRSSLLTGEEGGRGKGAGRTNYDDGKAWSSINYKSFNTLWS